jgi:hypothetical protein
MKPTAPVQKKFSVFVTTPSTPSRLPATLVRLKLVRCPHLLAPTLVVLPSMSRRPPLHSLGSRTTTVKLFNATRALSSLTHDLPNSLVLSLKLKNRYPRGFSAYPAASQPAVFTLAGYPIHR